MLCSTTSVRGVPVAQLTPVTGPAAGSDRDRIARLERLGILRPPVSSAPSKLLEKPPPGPRVSVSLSQLVIQERKEGW